MTVTSPAARARSQKRHSYLFDLSGQLAVVTGARRGIGLAIAEALAAAGADVVAVSAPLEAAGSAVAGRVPAHGRDCSCCAPTWPTERR